MISDYVNNVQSIPRVVKGVPLDRLLAAGESERGVGKGLAGGGADTSVVGTGWKLLYTTKSVACIKGFSDDMQKQDVPIGTAVTVV